MKTCSKCKETKELTEYHKNKNSKDGLLSMCKVCNCNKSIEWFNNNKDRHSSTTKDYYEKNKEKINILKKQYKEKNKDYFKEYHKQYAKKNTEKLSEYLKQYYQTNKENITLQTKEYRDRNKESIKKYRSEYYQKNKEKINTVNKHNYIKNRESRIQSSKNYRYSRLKTDIVFKLKCDIRSMILKGIKDKGYKKKSRTQEILGCSFEDFKLHLERQFTKGMNWDNRDKWHIDHIIPMATAKTEEDVIRLNHYTNLRPLWAEENLSKSDKIITHQLVLL